MAEGNGSVVHSGPQSRRVLVLTIPFSPRAVDPPPEFVARRVRDAMVRHRYAILEAAPERYVLAGSGPSAGMPGRRRYAVEYRDGTPGYLRFETTDVDVVVAVFEAYARDDPSYQTAYPWRPYRR